jgi:hypothetical protein
MFNFKFRCIDGEWAIFTAPPDQGDMTMLFSLFRLSKTTWPNATTTTPMTRTRPPWIPQVVVFSYYGPLSTCHQRLDFSVNEVEVRRHLQIQGRTVAVKWRELIWALRCAGIDIGLDAAQVFPDLFIAGRG